MTINVVLAEDNNLLRQGILRLLDPIDDINVVEAARNLPGLYAAVEQHAPDVVVTDIRMPPAQEDEGVRAASRFRDEYPDMGVVVLSQYVTAAFAVDILGDGASGRAYLLKDRVADVDQLAGAIRSVHEGGSVVDPAVVEELIEARTRSRSSALSDLNEREIEVLELLAQGKSNAAIASALFLSERAVEKNITGIFTKLDIPADSTTNRRVKAVVYYLANVPAGDGAGLATPPS